MTPLPSVAAERTARTGHQRPSFHPQPGLQPGPQPGPQPGHQPGGRPGRPSLALAATLATALLALAGCTGGDEPDAGAAVAPTTSAGGSATPGEKPPKPPRVRACYRLSLQQIGQSSSEASPVPGAEPHTTMTVAVGTLPGADGDRVPDVTAAAVVRRLDAQCSRSLDAFVGGDRSDRWLSRFQPVWFVPTSGEIARGARWVRCDLVAFGRGQQLMQLPRLRLEGVLDRPGGLQTFGLCGTAAPGSAGFRRVACRFPHAWTAISTVPIPGGERYPGVETVRAAGDSACSDQVNRRTSAFQFDYGWEWPTERQWRDGQRYGYCWAPASLA